MVSDRNTGKQLTFSMEIIERDILLYFKRQKKKIKRTKVLMKH